MKKKEIDKGLMPLRLGIKKELNKYVEKPPEWSRKKLERANESLRKCPPPKEWLQS